MNKTLLAIVSLGLMTVASAETVLVPVLDEMPSLVDGMLTDACWAKALKLVPFTAIQPNQSVLALNSEARLFVTKTSLYLGFIGYVKDTQYAQRQAADAAKGAFSVDHFEVFVDPGRSGNLVQLAFGINGAVVGNASGRIRMGTQVYGDRYQIEVEIPFDALPLKRSGFQSDWLFNVARAAKPAANDPEVWEFSSWSRLVSGTFHETDSFNRLSGIDFDLNASLSAQAAAARQPVEIVSERKLWASDSVRFVVKADAGMGAAALICRVTDADGEAVWSQTFPKPDESTVVDVPLSGRADARYRLEATLADATGHEIAKGICEDFWKIPPKRSMPKTRYTCQDRTIYRNGEFFFPILAWGGAPEWDVFRNHRFDTNEYFRCYHEILAEQKALGFNTIITTLDYFPEFARRALDDEECRKFFPSYIDYRKVAQLPLDFHTVVRLHGEHGLALIPFFHFEPKDVARTEAWLQSVLAWREEDNLVCWHLSDELDGGVDHNRRLNEFHHQVDPDRLTWVNCIQAIAANRDNADILSTDPYPIPYGPVTMVGFHVKRLMELCRPDQSPWIWVQMFGGEGSWTRSSTFEELKAMVFIALNRGARGIAYFNYYPSLLKRDGIHTMTQAEYDRLGPLNRRVERLAKVYCLGEVVSREADDAKLTDIAVIRKDDAFWISVVNGSPSEQRLRVVLPSVLPQSGVADVDDENRQVTYDEGFIEDVFSPFAVHIYRMRAKVK